MDYKKEIIEMIQEIHSEKILNLIYWFVKRGYKEERAGEYLKVRRFRTMFEYKEPKDGR